MLLANMDSEVSAFVQERTSEIKALVNRTARDIIEIGKKLIQVKEELGHGRFGAWLKAEFKWDERTARNFMYVADKFKSENFTDLDFAPSALYLLAAPSTPEEALQSALELAEKGETISHALAKELVERHKEENQLPNVTSLADDDNQAKLESRKDAEILVVSESEDDEDLAQFEAIAVEATEVQPNDDFLESVTNSKPKSDSVPFHCLLTHTQRERLFGAINQAKSQYELKTTAEALDVIAQEFLNAQ